MTDGSVHVLYTDHNSQPVIHLPPNNSLLLMIPNTPPKSLHNSTCPTGINCPKNKLILVSNVSQTQSPQTIPQCRRNTYVGESGNTKIPLSTNPT